jgi:C-terminal processing protease CtpA/Prc
VFVEDILIKIDGVEIDKIELDEAKEMCRGPEGSRLVRSSRGCREGL